MGEGGIGLCGPDKTTIGDDWNVLRLWAYE